MLGPPLHLAGQWIPAERAPGVAHAVHRDVEVQDPRAQRHLVSLSRVRPGARLACERMERLRTLSEAECYERCYGWRYTEDTVKVLPRSGVKSDPPDDVGERFRMLLELRLDARESEAA